MRIGVPLETKPGERRVASTPETVKKLVAQGHELCVQCNAGAQASFNNSDYEAAGATLVDAQTAFACDLVLKVRMPSAQELQQMKAGATLIGMLEPFNKNHINQIAQAKIDAFALESIPRTTRAQSMDVLSSQANIAGYKAVMLAANAYNKLIPMMMTAAGTIKAARVIVLGVGVAGLQAIATAKRLGAIIEASDVRPSVKEQIESLGAKFIEVSYDTDEERDAAQGIGGYAKPMPKSWLERQQAEVSNRVANADIIISTALIPGRPAPTLITIDMVKSMKPGSVIVDLAAGCGEGGNGGNCPLTEADKIIEKEGVTLIGYTNLPSLVATDASALYARNVFDFLKLILHKDAKFLQLPENDDIVNSCLMTQDGQIKINLPSQ